MEFWLVTLLAMLVILSPALMLRPSRRDQRLVQLRQRAREAGVIVRFAKPPLHEPPGGMVSYRWPYPQARPGPLFVLVRDSHASEALRPFVPGWRWRIEPLRPLSDEARRALLTMLSSLPADALVVESERGALTLWWRESWSVEALVEGIEGLAAARDALAAAQRERELGVRLPRGR